MGCTGSKSVEENTPSDPIDLKILIIGEPGVGKTALLMKFYDGTFNEQVQISLGEEFKTKTIEVERTTVNLQIFDTAGQEKFRTMTATYYRDSHGVIIVFDLNRKDTLQNFHKWHDQIKKYSPEDIPVVLVGNKTDLERNVTREDVKAVLGSHNIYYCETSAKDDDNVDHPFVELAKLAMSRKRDTVDSSSQE